jgi:hypothetical protein
MTETLIVKYSFVLYSFNFLTSIPKFRDIKNNIIQHHWHWWMRFPRKLWMYSMIPEVKFAYVVVFVYIRLFVYHLTSKHVPNKWVIRCTKSIYGYALTVILHNGWELQSWEMRHSPKHFDEIASLFSASCPFGKLSVRQNVRSAKRPFGIMSFKA